MLHVVCIVNQRNQPQIIHQLTLRKQNLEFILSMEILPSSSHAAKISEPLGKNIPALTLRYIRNPANKGELIKLYAAYKGISTEKAEEIYRKCQVELSEGKAKPIAFFKQLSPLTADFLRPTLQNVPKNPELYFKKMDLFKNSEKSGNTYYGIKVATEKLLTIIDKRKIPRDVIGLIAGLR
eukprot:TRINITY_DN65044_c0_g1_i1.p1 TRINITY_DN65044_c0_g1~~TRINITY_DN65044_c0_g1_i1.p1  ORF type:complete len:195 (-),score=8.92 TRINITY_DN65044_c0_g1_i1:430-972(-)